MDYVKFDRLLHRERLQDEPAFKDLLVEISPLPKTPANALGLYYPDADPALGVKSGTMWIPPDSDAETVFHELGHRYGDFHNGNLSEDFAEQYRLAHRPLQRSPVHLDEDHTGRNIAIAIGVVGLIALLIKRKK